MLLLLCVAPAYRRPAASKPVMKDIRRGAPEILGSLPSIQGDQAVYPLDVAIGF
jgi:hypothetical protein